MHVVHRHTYMQVRVVHRHTCRQIPIHIICIKVNKILKNYNEKEGEVRIVSGQLGLHSKILSRKGKIGKKSVFIIIFFLMTRHILRHYMNMLLCELCHYLPPLLSLAKCTCMEQSYVLITVASVTRLWACMIYFIIRVITNK